MPYRKLPDRTSETPLRHWLRANLPDERPVRTSPSTWQLVQHYSHGALARDLAPEAGIALHAVEGRVRYFAVKLGYQPGISEARLLPNGDLADHAARRDDATGCLLWTGSMHPSEYGPSASAPSGTVHRPQTKVQVRRWLWEREHGPLPRGRYVHADCGNPACIALEHAVVRTKAGTLTLAEIDSLRARKAEETLAEAAERLGVRPWSVVHVRGPGGKRGPKMARLRSWLREHLPAQRPAGVHDLDWRMAQRFAAGDSLAMIGTKHGVTRQMVHLRVKRVAVALGWTTDDGATTP
jgi:hypothetical protein